MNTRFSTLCFRIEVFPLSIKSKVRKIQPRYFKTTKTASTIRVPFPLIYIYQKFLKLNKKQEYSEKLLTEGSIGSGPGEPNWEIIVG